MQELELLYRAKELILSPGKLCTKTMARDKNGYKVYYGSPEACCFCALGAIGAATEKCISDVMASDKMRGKLTKRLNDASYRLFDRAIVDVNDFQGHEDVMKVFNEAIRTAEEERFDVIPSSGGRCTALVVPRSTAVRASP